MDNEQEIVVQRSATVGDIINDHINGVGGYAIAEKYGIDTERVKRIIAEADAKLAFVPADENGNKEAPVDSLSESLVVPLAEGEEPTATKGHK